MVSRARFEPTRRTRSGVADVEHDRWTRNGGVEEPIERAVRGSSEGEPMGTVSRMHRKWTARSRRSSGKLDHMGPIDPRTRRAQEISGKSRDTPKNDARPCVVAPGGRRMDGPPIRGDRGDRGDGDRSTEDDPWDGRVEGHDPSPESRYLLTTILYNNRFQEFQ